MNEYVRGVLGRPMRLAEKGAISALLKTRQRDQLGPLSIQARCSAGEARHGRLAMSVSKRYVRGAVERNRIKRQVREVFRLHAIVEHPFDILVSLRSRPAEQRSRDSRQTLRLQLRALLDRIVGRL